MGKIRIKTFEETTPEEQAKLKAKKEAKKADKARVSGMGGGQRIKTVGPSIEELEAIEKIKAKEESEVSETEGTENIVAESKIDSSAIASDSETTAEEGKVASTKSSAEAKKTKKEKFIKVKTIGKRHKANLNFVSKNQTYTQDQALETLKKFKKSKFDETVELHINVKEKNVGGTVVLPHGSGKTLAIKIADDALIEEISKGKISFDILVATPSMMPQLAKVARILGPKGLMPNPKNGTVTEKVEDAVKKLSGGQITYKTEPISPIIHMRVGKLSFEDSKLKENISALLTSVGVSNINSVTLKSTMSPGIRLDLTHLS